MIIDRTLPTRPLPDPDAVVQGEHFRITVLTDGLLRLEHSDDGVFEDRPSAFALYRNLPVPEYRVVDGPTHLEIRTTRLHLVYDRGPFSTSGLSIAVLGNVSTYHSVWRFGEARSDLGGTARTLDGVDGATPLEAGVVSRNGFALIDDSRTLLLTDDGWVVPRDGSRTDLYFFGYGHAYLEAARALYAVSGPPPLLPRFALGNWWSRYHRYTAEEYGTLIERFDVEGIPFSVAVLDMDWHLVDIDPGYGSGWTGYTWNRELFPDPQAFLGRLHEQGLRVTLNVHPADGVRAFEDAYPAMVAALGADTADGDPVVFDVTDRAFLEAYFDVLHHPLEDDGVDFWWLDWQSGPHSRIVGIDPLWMLNHFHFLDNGRDGARPLTFSRYAGPGSHRYPVGFSGDTLVTWASLDFQPYFTATASNIGYGWWSHDIGGHMMGSKDDELATRWVQLGVFSPILRLHSASNPFNSKEPWRFDLESQAAMTQSLRFRHRLLPYLYTMNHRAAVDGIPLVQPLYWHHPEHAEAYESPNQFMFGTDLMVSPITSPRDPHLRVGAVRTWLPAGDWTDIFTGTRYAGDRQLTMHRDLTSIPVLARAGAIVPLLAAPVPGNGADNPDALEVLVVIGADGQFTMIEDDGTGGGQGDTADALTPITYDQHTGTLTVGPATGALGSLPLERSWRLTFVGLSAGTASVALTVDGVAVEGSTDLAATRLSITVDGVAPASVVKVLLGEDPIPAANDVDQMLFELLDRAHIEFDLKARIHRLATSDRSSSTKVSHLMSLGLDHALQSAVTEILTAATDQP